MATRTIKHPRPSSATPLTPLLESKHGKVVPLTPRLAKLYGTLRLPLTRGRPYVYSNFVSTLDGVVSLNVKGHASGGDISGFSEEDRMVMGLLRALADMVVIGRGTLYADREQVWTAEAIYPGLAKEFRELRLALGKSATPLNVVVSGSADVDLRLPVFSSGKVPAILITTPAGGKRLQAKHGADAVEMRALRARAGSIPARAILDALCRAHAGAMILVEGGPRLLGDFYHEQLLDEQFLTLAPQIAGRDIDDRRLSLVMGRTFAPRKPRWGELVDLRRGGSLLFARYAFGRRREVRP